jgi:TPR repeat protein
VSPKFKVYKKINNIFLFQKAMKLYEMAAIKGHAKAMYNMGVFYVHGMGGLERNNRMARKYFNQAAELGQEDAIKALGMRAVKQETQVKHNITGNFKKSLKNDRAINIKQQIAIT